MPRSLLIALFAVFVFSPTAPAQTKASQIAKKLGWHSELDGARTLARQTGKPIFLVFRCDP
ncbi:MAG: thioredoxin family protein [Gemmataceae bacterium]|nr:thioredoxin family protein [Gemmataceae bacterium]MCI0739641.1 thioredoxin family protein [Gemmataceae bacterium]